MCETIVEAGILKSPDGSAPTAEQIWEYSPTGELFMIYEWYHLALIALGRVAESQEFLENYLVGLGARRPESI